ncbi:hypothetical protein D9619_011097 [Psilocybe cf. subviscida]|uniref:Uncharacterized protein n=1 Tax=Psilocybe cf. subviscida TaxID=2480587 RepID=A0A8H5BJ88_9AGAR|nr:hypothetical protein D9619_011097 [Psilocybe cf. subviscida]
MRRCWRKMERSLTKACKTSTAFSSTASVSAARAMRAHLSSSEAMISSYVISVLLYALARADSTSMTRLGFRLSTSVCAAPSLGRHPVSFVDSTLMPCRPAIHPKYHNRLNPPAQIAVRSVAFWGDNGWQGYLILILAVHVLESTHLCHSPRRRRHHLRLCLVEKFGPDPRGEDNTNPTPTRPPAASSASSPIEPPSSLCRPSTTLSRCSWIMGTQATSISQ